MCASLPCRGAVVKATEADFDAITLLTNKKGAPLLMAMGGGSSDDKGRLILQPSRGKVLLPDLQVGLRGVFEAVPVGFEMGRAACLSVCAERIQGACFLCVGGRGSTAPARLSFPQHLRAPGRLP